MRDLERAYQNDFRGIAHYPNPRKKGRNDTFRFSGRFQGREIRIRKLNDKWSKVRLPKIGWVRYRSTRPLVGEINNATICLAANGWHISFALAIEHDVPLNTLPAVGIDRGVAQTLTLSTGEHLFIPASLDALEHRQRRAQKVLARRKRGSTRHAKARRRVTALSARRARIRKDWHHRVSLNLSERFGAVVIEDLNIRNMTASAKGTLSEPGRQVRQKAGLNRSILNQGWHIFETLLDYKLEQRGGNLCKVPPHDTSQTCAECGAINSKSRKSQARFSCQCCGHTAHADINAAINILRRNTASVLVEEGHRLFVEARIGRGLAPPENPPPKGGGRC